MASVTSPGTAHASVVAVPVPRPETTCTLIWMGSKLGLIARLRNAPKYCPSNELAAGDRPAAVFAKSPIEPLGTSHTLSSFWVLGVSSRRHVDGSGRQGDDSDNRHGIQERERFARSHQEFPGVLVACFPAGDFDRLAAATDGDLTWCHQASQGLASTGKGAFRAGRLGLDVEGLDSARGNRGAPGCQARTAHDCQDQKPWCPCQHCWSPRPSLRSQRCQSPSPLPQR